MVYCAQAECLYLPIQEKLLLALGVKGFETTDDIKNLVRTSVAHQAILFCSYHIFRSSVIYYWTDTQQYEIYLFSNAEGIMVVPLYYMYQNFNLACIQVLYSDA